MPDSPVKTKTSSKVIDLLHTQIDDLKSELETLRDSHRDYKKRALVLQSKNDSLVDQLANYKHENDMINALLKRKERRIVDLEAEFNDVLAKNDHLKLSSKNLKIRCENLQDSLAALTAEFERLKIAYDALIAGQNEYKRHYQEEFRTIQKQLEEAKSSSLENFDLLSKKLESSDKDVDVLLDSLVKKRKSMDQLYVKRTRAVLELLAALARAAKLHGEESKLVLLQNVQVLNQLRLLFPEFENLVLQREETQVDITELLKESADALETNFSDSETADEVRNVSGSSNSGTGRRRRHKRNSLRISPEPETEPLPRVRNSGNSNGNGISGGLGPSGASTHGGNSANFRSRNGSAESGVLRQNSTLSQTRTPSNTRRFRNTSSSSNGSNNGGNLPNLGTQTAARNGSAQNTKNKGNRRLFYGGSNNFNASQPRDKEKNDDRLRRKD